VILINIQKLVKYLFVLCLLASAYNAQCMKRMQVFFDACAQGDMNIVKKYLEPKGARRKITIFFSKFLGSEYVDVNAEKYDCTPLYVACKNGHLEIAKLLLDKGAKVNEARDYYTPLIAACENGHLDVVRLLLEIEGIEVNEDKSWLETGYYFHNIPVPLVVAYKAGNMDVVKELLKHKDIDVNARVGRERETLLYIAYKNGDIEFVKELLKRTDIDVNAGRGSCDESLLHIACQEGDLEVVKELLKHEDIAVSKKRGLGRGSSSLAFAYNEGHLEIVKLLLRHKKIYVNREVVYLRYFGRGCIGITKLLLENGVRLDGSSDDNKNYWKRVYEALIAEYRLIVCCFKKAGDKLKFVLDKKDQLKKAEEKERFNFLLRIVFSSSMRKFLKEKDASFEQTDFYKLYKSKKVNLKDALGISLDGVKINLLKKYFSFKKCVGDTHFYYDKESFCFELKQCNRLNKSRKQNYKVGKARPDAMIFCAE